MGCDPQCHHTGKSKRCASQAQGSETAGTQIRNNQKCTEENQRRTKVIHQGQAAANQHRITDEHDNVALIHNTIQGGSTCEHKADFT